MTIQKKRKTSATLLISVVKMETPDYENNNMLASATEWSSGYADTAIESLNQLRGVQQIIVYLRVRIVSLSCWFCVLWITTRTGLYRSVDAGLHGRIP